MLRLSSKEHFDGVAPELAQKARDFSADVGEHGTITQLDDEWRDVLLSGCPNGRLMDLVMTLKVALHRYESHMVSDQTLVQRAATEHAPIAERLLTATSRARPPHTLEVNWINGMNRVLSSFKATPAAD